MKFFLLVSLLFSCSPNHQRSNLFIGGGSVIDNGGDTITCRYDAELATLPGYFEGIYTLDYFLTYDPRLGLTNDLPGIDAQHLLTNIESTIRGKLPQMADSFKDYLSLLGNTDESQLRVWKASALGLSDISDEDIIQQLPRNCLKTLSATTANLQQIIRRRKMAESEIKKVFYYYDHEKFESLNQNLPRQYSFLVVHEWLWDFIDSPWINRTINRLLHSQSTQEMSQSQLLEYLRSFNIVVDDFGRIGNNGEEEGQAEKTFRDANLCNSEHQLLGEFLSVGQYKIIEPGKSITLEIRVPELSSDVGPKLCGFALLLQSRSMGGAPIQFDIELKRGFAKFNESLSADSTMSQDFKYGLCSDPLCIERTGPLQELIFQNDFLDSRWSLKVTNPMGNQHKLEIRLPYLKFVDLKD